MGDHEVGHPELREQLVDRADRVIRQTLAEVRRGALAQQAPEVVDDEGVYIVVPQQELDVVIVVEQPAHDPGVRLHIPLVRVRPWTRDAVLLGVPHQAETDDGSSLVNGRRRW